MFNFLRMWKERCWTSCSFLGFLSFLCSLGSDTGVSLVDSLVSDLLIDLSLLHGVSDGLLLASIDDLWKGEELVPTVLGSSGELLLGGVVDHSLLCLALLGWEEDKFRLVFIQFSDISGKAVSVLVVSSMIDGDTNSLCELGGETSTLNFSKREASSKLNLGTIPSSLTVNEWSQIANWSGESCSSLSVSSLLSQALVSLLVEVALDSHLPMLPQVRALKDIIMLYHVAY